MNNLPIGIIDSGIGGISVLLKLDEILSANTFIYYGDNDNAPYGQKGKRELLSRALNCTLQMNSYNVENLVVACNTLSVNILPELEYYSRKKCFGVFPPVEKNLLFNKTVLFCTPKTALNYQNVKNLYVVSLPCLAKEIENKILSLERINLDEQLSIAFDHPYTYKFKSKTEMYSTIRESVLVLGCTHYVLIQNKIFNHFQPQKILSGNDGLIVAMKERVESLKSLDNIKKNEILFLGTSAEYNKKIFENLRKKIKKN